MPDGELAAARGVTVRTVKYHREMRGIPEFRHLDKEYARERLRKSKLLGAWADSLVAERHECPPWLVVEIREELGIPPLASFDDIDLQTMPDDRLAKKYKTTLFDAFIARSRAGYPRTSRKAIDHDWGRETRLGKVRDEVLARKIGCHRSTVARHRTLRGIPPLREGDFSEVDDFGEVFDSVIAERLGVSRSLVSAERRKRGIPSARETHGDEIDWDSVTELGKVGDQVLAERLGVSRSTVVRQRKKRDIPPVDRGPQTKYDWDSVMHMLGNVPDEVVAKRLDAPVPTVIAFRKRNQISAFQG